MTNFFLIIRARDESFKIGPFDTDRWPNEGDILKMNLIDIRAEAERSGPQFRVIEVDRDENEITVVRTTPDEKPK